MTEPIKVNNMTTEDLIIKLYGTQPESIEDRRFILEHIHVLEIGERIEKEMDKPTPPPHGYILPLWRIERAYRATARGYMKREAIEKVENQNGFEYTLKELDDASLI